MSKQSYMAGFCKKATENKIDPQALARFAVEKAADAPAIPNVSVWDKVLSAIDTAKNKTKETWDGLDPKTRDLLKLTGGALGGAALGSGLGAAVVGKKGLRAGSILGALGGAAAAGSQVDWKALAEHFGNMSADAKAKVQAHNAQSEASAKAHEATPGAGAPTK